jgi:lysophospholipase L1-like esterase
MYRTNSSGFNDGPHSIVKRPGIKRIAILGDSFAWGAGVEREQNLASLIQRQADREGIGIESLNMGIPGVGPRAYLGLLRSDVLRLNVDVAIVLVYVGNDITDAHPDFRNRVWLGHPRNLLRAQYLIGVSPEYFYLYRFFRFTFRSVRQRLSSSVDRPPDAAYSYDNFMSIHRKNADIHERVPTMFTKRSYEGVATILNDLKHTAKEAGVTLLVVLAPHEPQVNHGLREALFTRYRLKASDFDLGRPQRILGTIMKAASIPFVDLYPSFLEAAKVKRLYLPQDTHWNQAGHVLAARETWEYVTRHGLI